MKPNLLCCLISQLLFSSCGLFNNRVTHAPIMPNAPNFTDGQQVQSVLAASFDHLEVQGGISPINHLGITGGLHFSKKGLKQREAGLDAFTHIGKSKLFFIAFSAGKGKGEFDGEYKEWYDKKISVNTNYTYNYYQPSVYYLLKISEPDDYDCFLKFSFTVRKEEINYSQFSYRATYSSFRGRDYSYDILFTKEKPQVQIITPFLGIAFDAPYYQLYFQAQVGRRIVQNGFKVDHTVIKGSPNVSDIEQKTHLTHPFFSGTMINVAIGYKIDLKKTMNLFKTLNND